MLIIGGRRFPLTLYAEGGLLVFSSLIFLFVFLAANLAVYFLVPEQYRNPVLLGFSLVFYSWGGVQYVVLLAGEALVSWFIARQMGAVSEGAPRKALMAGECVVLLGLLAYFKYTGFFLSNIQLLTGAPDAIPDIVLPIGISFYTFQLISYVADVYAGRVEAQPRYWKLLLYASLFHQCIAGPIVRYETVAGEIDHREITLDDMYCGMRRFSVGLAKKAILANSCAAAADALLPIGDAAIGTQCTTGYWLGMLFYMLEIYLDFSAYSDMAIGMGRMVGFHYLENFNYPYMASSVQDFWRRWHISLSSFFRDYVYIPLGGSRCSTGKYVRNMAVVWLLTGFWHGASWNYILWGAYFLVFLLLEKFVLKPVLEGLPAFVGHVYALVVVYFGWILFHFENAGELGQVLIGVLGLSGNGFTSLAVHTVFLQNLFLLVFCCVACTNLGARLHEMLAGYAQGEGVVCRVVGVLEAAAPLVLLVLAIISLAGASYNPFIYFRF